MTIAVPAPPRLWLFNLDAELELERPGPYQTPAHIARSLAQLVPQVRGLMAPFDRELDDAKPLPPRHELAACWSPTPSALRRLATAGAAVSPTPGVEVLRRVSSRQFYFELGAGAPGAQWLADEASLEKLLASDDDRLFKRRFGFAGRGQRRIRRAPSDDDRRWLRDSLARGGLLAEPWLEIEREFSLHGFIQPDGALQLGRPCVQTTDAQRAWVKTRLAAPGELGLEETRALERSAGAAAEALFGAGYHGPFGIDAYLYRRRGGTLAFNAWGELNARYTMGFPIGLGPAPIVRVREAPRLPAQAKR